MPSASTERPILVQYWHADPTTEVIELMDTWRTAEGEGFEYLRFDDVSAQQFIEQHFGQRALDAYLACAVPAMRADIFRICALLVRPGLYVDADTRRSGVNRPRRAPREDAAPLLPLFARIERGILFKRDDRVANGFIVVKRRQDPLLNAILDAAITNIERRVSNNVYLVTGPGIATRWLKQFGPEHEYFRNFEFWTQEALQPYMRMVGNLPYKRTTDHWVNAQNVRSIFVRD